MGFNPTYSKAIRCIHMAYKKYFWITISQDWEEYYCLLYTAYTGCAKTTQICHMHFINQTSG